MEVLTWNGTDLPESLRHLPPGRYVLEPVDDVPPLTPDQEAGIIQALRSADAGKGSTTAEVRARLERRFKQ
jgi:hypothetical protein